MFPMTRTITKHILGILPVPPILLLLIVLAGALVVVAFATPPIPRFPEPNNSGSILAALLTAQAAIAALTLAVTLFMMQAVRARIEIDDRMYREYVRRSRVREILWASLLSVGVTGVLLVSEGFITGNVVIEEDKPELRNFILASGVAFLLNLVSAVFLFERAILYSRPEQWMALRREIQKTDVREAIRAFVRRTRRALDAQRSDEIDFTNLLPDQAEGSADEAVRTLLDDGRRAMLERRHEKFGRSLDYVRDLVKYAMDEIKATGISWAPPGSQPEWPPLRELTGKLYSFRKDVIRQSDREYLFQLLRFDYRLVRDGIRERCGELFTVGLNGYRWNYQIVNSIGDGDFHEIIRDRFAINWNSIIFNMDSVEAFPYAMEIVKHQELLLSDAMHSDKPSDFEKLYQDFEAGLQFVRFNWNAGYGRPSDASKLFQKLERRYRIALMGLGGRALLLDESNRIEDAAQYLKAGRSAYDSLETMADDLASALNYDNHSAFSLWEEWERESVSLYKLTGIMSERYPLLFFALLLMELSSETMPVLNLHGRAKRVLDWFNENSDKVQTLVQDKHDITLEERLEFATEVLRSAVRRDEVAEDYEIISRDLSPARVSAFKSEVYEEALTKNPLIGIFKRTGACISLPSDSDESPKERVFSNYLAKAYFTDTTKGALIQYAPYDGKQWGRALSDDVLMRFCKELEGSPQKVAFLDAPGALLQEIDLAIEELNPSSKVVVVLAGNWMDIIVGIETERPDGYLSKWQLPENDNVGEDARYNGHPILRASRHESRRVFVVEPARWGNIVLGQTDDAEDLRIDVKPISIDRARQLLKSNPNHFASEPDKESKLRKLQTRVEIVFGSRAGFCVSDPTRARVIIPGEPSEL